MNPGTNTEEKIALFVEWMKGDHIFAHLDARAAGVQVPSHLSDNANLKLKLSYAFQGETKHDEVGISVYLKFEGKYELCVLPWPAVWGFTNADGETCLWAADLPPELEHLAELGSRIAPPPAPASSDKKNPPSLSLVDKPKKKPELRRIK